MSFNPSSAAGTQLLVSASSPVSYILIEGAQGINGPNRKSSEIEYTAISDSAKKFMADLPDLGQITFDLAWDPSNTQHALLESSSRTGAVLYFKKLMDDAGAAYGESQGFVSGWAEDHQKGTFNKVSVTVKLTGDQNLVP